MIEIEIDLDREPTAAGTRAAPGPWVTARRLRTGALAVSLALLLAAGGSAPPGPPPLTELTTLTVAPDQGFLLTADRVFVGAERTAGSGRSISAHEPGRGRLLWTSEYDRDPGAGGLVEQVGDGLLVRTMEDDVPHTTAVDARTGAVRWSVAGSVEALADGRTGLLQEHIFSPDAGPVDPGSRSPSSGYWRSSSGLTYVAPPIGLVLHAIDLDTGRPLWDSVPVADGVSVRRWSGVPVEDVPLVVTTLDGRVQRWDVRTGGPRHSLPAVGTEQPAVVVVGDLLALQRADAAELSAYDIDTFARRWQRDLGSPELSVGDCGGRLCVGNGLGWRLLDPVTGADAAEIDHRTAWVVTGDHRVEMRSDEGGLIRTVDPVSGRTLADLTGWTTITTALPGAPMLLTRELSIIGPTWFGLLAPDATEVHLLGLVPYRATGCQLAADLIACKDRSDSVRLWRYRR